MPLLDNCNPRLINVAKATGCTLTRADIVPMTAAAFEAQGMMEVGMDKLIAQTKECRIAGVAIKPLRDLLMSRMKPGKQTIVGKDQYDRSVIAPWSMVPQRSVVNFEYWTVESGLVDPGAGVGTVHDGSWQLVIINSLGDFASPLVDLEKYFLPGTFVKVLTSDPVTGVGRSLQFKITASVNADAGGVEKAKITLEPPYTEAGWAALDAGEKAIYAPTNGVLINLANSISNYESWCDEYPAENTWKLKEYWWQTIRTSWRYDDAYVEALTAPLTSNYFKKFATLPLADIRKAQGAKEQRDFFNTIFYGEKVHNGQTQATYTTLPQVFDPTNPTCLLEYKANTEGIRTQLNNCGRVLDLQNSPVDLDVIKNLFYILRRHRGGEGIVDIDVMGNRFTFAIWQYAFIQYIKNRYSIETTRFYTPGQKLMFKDQVMWNYDTFEFPEDGVRINFIHDDYFDDHLAAFPDGALKARGRQLWVIDWSDIDIAVADVRSVNRTSPHPEVDALYKCVIDANITHIQLHSQTIQVQVCNPDRHLIIENFTDHCPALTAVPCETS